MAARVSTIEKWVAVADICRCLHNYNAVLEITSAFNRSAIFRLKKTWMKVSKPVSAREPHCQSCALRTRCWEGGSAAEAFLHTLILLFFWNGDPNFVCLHASARLAGWILSHFVASVYCVVLDRVAPFTPLDMTVRVLFTSRGVAPDFKIVVP